MKLKTMGVINLTPNSFSDGGEVSSKNLLERIHFFNQFDFIDIGAESTAPMNQSISADDEWERLLPLLPLLREIKATLSLDTYHPETIFKLCEIYPGKVLWNDVSGKFDDHVEKFLRLRKNCFYVFSHNLSPSREKTLEHMNHLSSKTGEEFLCEMVEYFTPYKRERVIFDPCLGFSKTYEQNWMILDHLSFLFNKLQWESWLLGFSRKSFLRKKFQCELTERERLDELHLSELKRILPSSEFEIIVRTHRPELLAKILN